MATRPRYLCVAFATALTSLLIACATPTQVTQTPAAPAEIQYPATTRGDVVDIYHDMKVADPYRWFEDANAQPTKDWVTAQNTLAQPYLEALPQRAWLGNRLKALWTYERFGVPQREGGHYFFLRNDGTQDQSVLYVADSLNATPRVLVDPNGKREDATIALSQWSPSPDGKLVAYALSDGGTDWNIWHFRRVADGSDLPVTLKFSKFWPVSWASDSSGVYYSRYPVKPGESCRDRRARRRCRAAGRVLPQARRAADRGPARLPGDRSSVARACRAGHRRWSLPDHQSVRRLRNQRRAGAGPAQARRQAAAAVHRLGRALQLHGLAGRRAVFPDHPRRAARPRDRGESGQAGGHRLAQRRAAGRTCHQQHADTSAAASWSNTRATRAASSSCST